MEVPKDPLEFFRAEFFKTSETSDERVEALRNLDLIATAIGPQATKSKLLPILLDIGKCDADDEVLHTLALQMPTLAALMLNEADYHHLLPILDTFWHQEETVVREAAAESLQQILDSCSNEFKSAFVSEHLFPLCERLLAAEQFTARASGAKVLPICYPLILDAEMRRKAAQLLVNAAKDSMPIVQKSVATALVELTKTAMTDEILELLFPTILRFWTDDLQDTLRSSAIEASVVLTTRLTEEEIQQHTGPILDKAAQDSSWRLASTIPRVPYVEDSVTNWYENVLVDVQTEVQAGAVESLAHCLPMISVDKILNKILPLFPQIIDSPSTSTKASLGSLFGMLAMKIDRDATGKILIDMLKSLLKHSAREVRYNAVLQFADLCKCLGPDNAQSTLMDLINAAMTDNQWRIRLALTNQLSQIAEISGPDIFSQKQWMELYFLALLDTAHAVRKAAVSIIKDICQSLGHKWVSQHLANPVRELFDLSFSDPKSTQEINNVEDFYASALRQSPRSIHSYVLRNTLAHAMEALALVLDKEEVNLGIVPRLVSVLKDPIPNVRYIAVEILTRLDMKGEIDQDAQLDSIRSTVASMALEDADMDVRSCASLFITRMEMTENTNPDSLGNNKVTDGCEILSPTRA